jgi:hypothetical protein
VIVVAVGQAVEFENRDSIYHNVFSVSPTKRFDVGKIPPGGNRRVTFDRPGVLGLYCDLHPEEAGFVMVLPSPAWARPDRAGNFVLPPLPAGEYTVTTWHPTLGERRRKVALPGQGGATVELRF